LFYIKNACIYVFGAVSNTNFETHAKHKRDKALKKILIPECLPPISFFLQNVIVLFLKEKETKDGFLKKEKAKDQ
jgi:hypothetical protein